MTPQTDVALAPFCTMRVGGPARWFVEARRQSEVIDALRWASLKGVPMQVFGGGSNIVVADEGVDGLVVRVAVLGIGSELVRGCRVYSVGAGEPWDPFVADTVSADDAGLECLSGIPGLVGGTPIQNVGAYGQEVSDTITQVQAVDRAIATSVSFSRVQCGFGYRTSRFKQSDAGRYVVTRVEFSLAPHGSPTIQYGDVIAFFDAAGTPSPTLSQAREGVLAIRRRKGMVIEDGNPANRSCGSFFVNPVVPRADFDRLQSAAGTAAVPHFVVAAGSVKIPAAWLIERAGFPKGTTRGPVGISPFQAQALVNHGGARAADVVALACEVKRAVWRTFGISLVPEPVFVGFAGTPELQFLLSHRRASEDEGR